MGDRNMRIETSKLILIGSWAVALTLTGITIHGSYLGRDMSQVAMLAALSWGELTAAHGFYFWKAKNENRAKGTQKLIKDLAAKHGIDAVARIAELVFRD